MRDAAAERFPGDYRLLSPGIDPTLFEPTPKRRTIVVELRPNERVVARGVVRALRELPGWEVVLLRTKPLIARPAIPRDLAGRVRVRTARNGAARAALLNEAAVFLPGVARAAAGAPRGEGRRLRDRRAARGRGAARARGRRRRAARGGRGAAGARGREAPAPRPTASRSTRSRPSSRRSTPAFARGSARAGRGAADPLADREWIVADLHMHTSWSFDCAIDPAELVDHAESEGLGAIAITDHNVFGGALETADLARDRDLVVIPGEEVKTDGQGEVIGLFLEREIPRGMPFADTIAAIREQGGLVYLPHPFDRMHSIPEPATLHRHLADIDVFEVYNARLLFEAHNDEALRFARKYDLVAGAGSDAHVLQGVGTGALRMRAFRDPEEFLISLRSAEVLRRPKSLAYLQSLKWMAQVKEKVR